MEGRDRRYWHLLADHLLATSRLSEARGARLGIGKAAALAGLLHDLGKYTAAFQRRLDGAGEKVDHSTAGAQQVLAQAGIDRGMAELIAYAIAGHHAGMPDREGESGSLSERLKRPTEVLDAIWQRELEPDVRGLLPTSWRPGDKERLGFQLAVLGRMIFSCLVDADYRDTEAFYAAAEGRAVDRAWPRLGDEIDRLVAGFDMHMRDKAAGAGDSDVNRLRGRILDHVRAGAAAPTGIFSLTVPTGGGKTLASLAFALDHARAHGLDRIIYAIPFTSVIDQTAAIFREVLGDEMVLEHHSAIEEERVGGRERREKLALAMEDWAAPVVVTTNVQLFESLFANRPSRCRKLHNIARSVIVLDEAQTIPRPLLRPCVAMLDELARNYGCSVVLCTATQPALVAPRFKGGFAPDAVRELAPDPADLACRLRRVSIRRAGEMDDDALSDALAGTPQGLVIVNSRAHALALYRRLAEGGVPGIVHLTTRQYAAHRRQILADVRQRLKDGLPCRVVATSLVEAGVDVDFPLVWRAEAGLDQVAQAAGRCNREGRRGAGDSVVTIFQAPQHPAPREIALLAADFARMADNHPDLLSPEAIEAYFHEVYWRVGERLDAHGILDSFPIGRQGTSFAYRTVADRFRMIESGLAPVIVARDQEAQDALAELERPLSHPGRAARRLQPYTVQVPPRARALLLANEHVRFLEQPRFHDQFAVLRADKLYQEDAGLLWEDAAYLVIENAIF